MDDIIPLDDCKRYELPENWTMIRVCGACPEAYNIKDSDNNMVAYLRLRHGIFRVHVPDIGGEIIFVGTPIGNGIFSNDEQDEWLRAGIKSIKKHYGIE